MEKWTVGCRKLWLSRSYPPSTRREKEEERKKGNSIFTSACRDSFSAEPLILYQMSSKWADVEHSTKFGKVVSKGHKKSMVWGELWRHRNFGQLAKSKPVCQYIVNAIGLWGCALRPVKSWPVESRNSNSVVSCTRAQSLCVSQGHDLNRMTRRQELALTQSTRPLSIIRLSSPNSAAQPIFEPRLNRLAEIPDSK